MSDIDSMKTHYDLLVQNSEILKRNSLALYESHELLEEQQCIATTNSATLISNKKTLASNSDMLMANHLELENNKATLSQIRAILASFHNLLGAQSQSHASETASAEVKADHQASLHALAVNHALLESILGHVKSSAELAKANNEILLSIAAKVGAAHE